MNKLLLFAISLAVASAQNTCGPQIASLNFDGADLGTSSASSAAACCQHCTGTANCLAWSWDSTSNTCSAKSGLGSPEEDQDYVSGILYTGDIDHDATNCVDNLSGRYTETCLGASLTITQTGTSPEATLEGTQTWNPTTGTQDGCKITMFFSNEGRDLVGRIITDDHGTSIFWSNGCIWNSRPPTLLTLQAVGYRTGFSLALDPAFDPDVTSYTINDEHADQEVEIDSTIRAGDTRLINGIASTDFQPIGLFPGKNGVHIHLESALGSTNDYTIEVSRIAGATDIFSCACEATTCGGGGSNAGVQGQHFLGLAVNTLLHEYRPCDQYNNLPATGWVCTDGNGQDFCTGESDCQKAFEDAEPGYLSGYACNDFNVYINAEAAKTACCMCNTLSNGCGGITCEMDDTCTIRTGPSVKSDGATGETSYQVKRVPHTCTFDDPHPNSYLSGHACGDGSIYTDLVDAEHACCECGECNGLTQANTGGYTLRRGSSLQSSGSGESSLLLTSRT